eukprot:2527523-Alexandrium_andersonii.AAC.1
MKKLGVKSRTKGHRPPTHRQGQAGRPSGQSRTRRGKARQGRARRFKARATARWRAVGWV